MSAHPQRKTGCVLVMATGLAAGLPVPAHAADITWDGGGDGVTFGDAQNWSPDMVPDFSDTAIFDSVFTLVTFSFDPVNERFSVTEFGDGTLSLGDNDYRLVNAPTTVEVAGSVTVSGGRLSSNAGALVHPSGAMTLLDANWDHEGDVTVGGSLTLSSVDAFATLDCDQMLIEPGGIATVGDGSTLFDRGLLTANGSLVLMPFSHTQSNDADIGPDGTVTVTDAHWLAGTSMSFMRIDGDLQLGSQAGLTSGLTHIGANGSVALDDSGWQVLDSLEMLGGGSSSLNITTNSFVSARGFRAGQEPGTMTVTIRDSSFEASDPFFDTWIASDPASSVTVLVDGVAGFASWRNAGGLFIGASGSAEFTVQNRGFVESSCGVIAMGPQSVASVIVTGENSGWVMTGDLELGANNGEGSLCIADGAFVDCGDAEIGGGEIASSATVTGFESEWEIAGELVIGPGELTISDGGFVFSDEGFVGSEGDGGVTITGEDSTWINVGLLIFGIEDGSGTLDIAEGGFLLSGPTYLGLFADVSGAATIDGAGSHWTCLSDVHVGEFGSGSLSITNGGTVSSTTGFVGSFAGSDGSAMIAGAGSIWTSLVSVRVGNFGSGSLTVAAGGIVATPQIIISETGAVTGDGILTADVENSGVTGPGLSLGTLAVEGAYIQTADGMLEIELAVSGSDLLAMNGAAALAGTLQIIEVTGDEPDVGQMFTILTASSIAGQFDTVTGQGEYDISYESDAVIVTVLGPSCPEDLDGSGAVDFGDILAILSAWGNKGGPEDLDESGIVDFGDILAVLAAWGPCE